MKKQTAVEWLIAEIQRLPLEHRLEKQHLYAHALKMEKEQIIEAHGLKREHQIQQGVDYWITKCGLEYYDQTYGGDK
jgi:hypothetical protein